MKRDAINVKIPIARFFPNKKSFNKILSKKLCFTTYIQASSHGFRRIKENPWKLKKIKISKIECKKFLRPVIKNPLWFAPGEVFGASENDFGSKKNFHPKE